MNNNELVRRVIEKDFEIHILYFVGIIIAGGFKGICDLSYNGL